MNEDSESHATERESSANSPQDSSVTSPRRKSLQSGFSLLARGEPKIWFTGGMLVVCLAMIVGLLALILYSGLPSFWARPIDLLALDDGTLEIGQLQSVRSEAIASTDMMGALTTEGTEEVDGNGSGREDRTPAVATEHEGQRRYFRTGNFKLTGQHYRWLGSHELGPSGIGRPEWAMVVEREEWGRLYGLPLTVKKQWLPNPESQRRLSALAVMGEIFNKLSAEDSNRLEAIQQRLESVARDLRDNDLRSQIASAQVASNADLWVQTTDAEDWLPYSDTSPDNQLDLVQQKWADYDSAIAALQMELRQVITWRRELERSKHEISRMDARLSELRVNVRRAEIETDAQAAVQVDTCHYLLEQQDALAGQIESIPELKENLRATLSDNAQVADYAVSLLNDYVSSTLSQEAASLSEQLDQWAAPAASQPKLIRDAIAEYQQGYREIVKQKQPLESRLLELEELLAQTQVDFAVPTGSLVLLDVPNQDLEALLAGQLTALLIEKLTGQGLEPTDEPPKIETLSDGLVLASVRDQLGDKQLLAISRIGYLSSLDGADIESVEAGGSQATWQVQLMGITNVECGEIVRAVGVNRLGLGGKLAVYVDRWREFLLEDPREANTEGGVFPAIWGTIVMTLIMTIVVVPFGVMAALYLREYTKSGALVSIIRISINNLAGVPSIVYGVFGFSFFCYTIGAFIDGGPRNAEITSWPPAAWFAILGMVAAIGTVAFFFSFLGGGQAYKRTKLGKWMSRVSVCLWLASLALCGFLILKSPFFSGFYEAYLPNPTFGKGGLLWASLTLALLTLPVVIVATEEALAAVPNSLREGSLACGASKWQTIWRIVLPHARPGILTGAILAMARGAGEVAPLMLVGALPSAKDLPLDTEFPFFHGSRSFMHLGYQIFTLGFNSQNSEAAKPMVFTCTLLLILIVATLNLFAIFLRARLKRQFQGAQF